MKMRILICLSLALNLALVTGILLPTKNVAAKVFPVATPKVVETKNIFSQPSAETVPVRAFHWDQIASDDLKVYRDNLRAIGCPEKTVREIILCVINQEFNPRRHAILTTFQDQFWSLLARGDFARRQEIPRTDWGQALAALSAERQKLIDDVLGKDYFAIEAESQAHRASSKNDPEESDAANWADSLAGFELTEGEWRAVTQLRSDFDQMQNDLATADLTDAERQQRQAELETNLEKDIKNALGADRFAGYQMAADGQFQEVRNITQRYSLPDSLAIQAYQIQQEAVAQAKLVQNNQTLSAENQQSLLIKIQQETQRTLTQTLGDKVFSTYQQYNGDWLQGLR
jgi:hypothetical protein